VDLLFGAELNMRNIKLLIEYDGTNYKGWQIQKNAPSIQEEIVKAIYKITGESIDLNGSGRTDAGVHARGQVANFVTSSNIREDRFADALNSVLPEDIVIKRSEEVSLDFHARFSAKGKKYSYTLYNSKYPPAIGRNYVYHVRYCDKLDIEKMVEGSRYFIGTHDFAGFMSAGSNVKDTVRTIYSIDFHNEGSKIRIEYIGNGFLYNMVRIITGTLLYCGLSRIDVTKLDEIILSKDRVKAGITIPAKGLCLEEVYY
jgi:tRNA pseudouridine38-40 synthase